MASFKDKKGREWKVELDAILIEDIKEKHSVNLVDLENDPLQKMWSNPMLFGAVSYLLCEEQIEERSLDPKEFIKHLPHVDEIFGAIREAVIGFFPSGRTSHVREVLAAWDKTMEKMDEISLAAIVSDGNLKREKLRGLLENPNLSAKIGRLADATLEKMIEEKYPEPSNQDG